MAADCVALGIVGEEEACVKELAKSILDTPTGLVGCFRPNLCSAPAIASEGAAAGPGFACKNITNDQPGDSHINTDSRSQKVADQQYTQTKKLSSLHLDVMLSSMCCCSASMHTGMHTTA